MSSAAWFEMQRHELEGEKRGEDEGEAWRARVRRVEEADASGMAGVTWSNV